MNLVKQYYDDNAKTKYDKKRAIISCEGCNAQSDVRYTYYLDCQKKNRKFCKTCEGKKKSIKHMEFLNSQEPLSVCTQLIHKNGKKPVGVFKCTRCGNSRERTHRETAYEQYCAHCSRQIKGLKSRKHSIVGYDHSLSRRFSNMIQRCYNPNNNRYPDWGGRGVTICQEWLNDRTKFYDWALSNGYSNELSLDKDKLSAELKIEPSIYSPETCFWATALEQSQHKRVYGSGSK